jgi:hypothetical protein
LNKPTARPLYVAFLLLAVIGPTLGGCAQRAYTPHPTATRTPTATPAPLLTPAAPPDLQAVQSWIRQQAIPLKATDPQASLDDLQPLQQIVGNASIVGLGEGSHDAHEFFTLTQRVLAFLVERMGFTLFATESS